MLLALLACAAPATSWVAVTDDAEVTLGVAVDGDAIEAYVCGQDDAVSVSRWFSGAVADAAFSADEDGWTLHVTGLDAEPTATFATPGGTTYTWSGAPVDAPEGLYAADDAGCRTGLLWSGDTAVGTWCDEGGRYVQVEPPDTLAPAEDGTLAVRVATPDGLRELRLGRVPVR